MSVSNISLLCDISMVLYNFQIKNSMLKTEMMNPLDLRYYCQRYVYRMLSRVSHFRLYYIHYFYNNNRGGKIIS